MLRTGFVLLAAISPLALTLSSPAQTALQRIESRIREQLGKSAPPAAPAAPAAPALAAPTAPAGKATGQAWLGVVADDEKDRGRGVRVLEIAPEGPAAKSGFQQQDLITSVAGIRVRQMSDLADMMDLYTPGEKVAFEVSRDGKTQKIDVTLGRRPAQAEAKSAPAEAKPALTVPKVEEPLLLGPSVTPSTPIATPPPPAPAAPAPAPVATPAPADDHSRIEALERRLAELEKRLAELERATAPPPKPGK